MQRIPAFKVLDAFRGIAALWVVMRHSCDRWIGDGHLEYVNVPLYAFSMRGQIGVTLFFLISGYCITAAAYGALNSGKTFWRYSYERLRRIYPPYLAALTLAVLSTLCIGFANSHHLIGEVHHLQHLSLNPLYWFANIFLVQSEFNVETVDVVYWSLCYEISFYVFIGVFLVGAKWFATRRSTYAGTVFFVTALGGTTVLTVLWLLLGQKQIFPFDQWHQFAIGGLLFFLMEFKPTTFSGYSEGFRRIVLGNVGVVSILIVLYAVMRNVEATGLDNPSSRVRSIIGLVFAAVLLGLRKVDDKVALHPALRPLMWVGSFSYALYLTHNIVIPYVDVLSRKAGLNGSMYWIAFWLQMAVAIGFGRIFYVLVERHFISKRQVQRLSAEHVV